MLSLVNASVYIIQRVKKEGKLNQLGKIKLYKILYLAEWNKFNQTNKTLFNIAWYRIQMGPALQVHEWENLTQSLSEEYGIKTAWGQSFNYSQVIFSTQKPLNLELPKDCQIYIDQAIDLVIDTTAEEAARLTYLTDPMRWLTMQELALGGSVQFTEFRVDDPERIKFTNLAKKYQDSLIDIPDIVRKMGDAWTEDKVVLFLEGLGTTRKLIDVSLTKQKRAEILEALLRFHLDKDQQPQLTSQWVEKTVIASQRIEGIYVAPDAFVEDYASIW